MKSDYEQVDFQLRFLDFPDGFGTVDLEEDKLILFAVIFGAIILLGLMIWGGVSAVRVLFLRKSKPEDFTEDAEVELPPLTELHAVVTEKDAQIVHTGSAKTPSHHIQFRILFTLENNETRVLDVPQEAFERIYKNQIGTLALQDREFFDFSVE